MTNKNDKPTSLSEDLRQIFIKKFGHEADMMKLCCDHPDPFLLFDREPVLGITCDDFVGVFSKNSSHFYLSGRDVCRIGVCCNLPVANLVALIIKSEWENFTRDISVTDRQSDCIPDKNPEAESPSAFRPDYGLILKTIRSNNDNIKTTYEQIEFLTGDLLSQKSFIYANDKACAAYAGKDMTEESMLSSVSAAERERYFRLKELWNLKSAGLDDFLLILERKKRLNLATENNYMRIFGRSEAEKAKLKLRIAKYTLILNHIQNSPGLSYRQLIIEADKKVVSAERTRQELKNKIFRSRNYIDTSTTGISQQQAPYEFRNSYTRDCKKILRRLFFLLHSDTCPNYNILPEGKKSEINNLWLDLMKSTKDEIYSFSPEMLLYNLPDINHLKEIYLKACTILGLDPEFSDKGNRLDFMIRRGITLEKILLFLENETAQIELHLARLELIQESYTNEEQTQKYLDALEDRKYHSEKLGTEIQALKDEITALKNQISIKYAEKKPNNI